MSASGRDTQAVRRLLMQVIDSFEKLEIVLHVHRTGFALKPAAADVAKATGLSIDDVRTCITALEQARVLDPAGPWRTAIDELAAMYDEDRIEVLDLMTRASLDRVRHQAARVFADAFVLRPKKKEDPDA
jgi:hypothetical protein